MLESLAQNIIARAQAAAAKQLDVSACISVVDEWGLPYGFLRMDDALSGSIDVSMKSSHSGTF